MNKRMQIPFDVSLNWSMSIRPIVFSGLVPLFLTACNIPETTAPIESQSSSNPFFSAASTSTSASAYTSTSTSASTTSAYASTSTSTTSTSASSTTSNSSASSPGFTTSSSVGSLGSTSSVSSVQPVFLPPVVLSPYKISVAEGTTGTAYTFYAHDFQSRSLSFAVAGADIDQFSLSSGRLDQLDFSNPLSLGNPTDANGDGVFEIQFAAENGLTGAVVEDITVKVVAATMPAIEMLFPKPFADIGLGEATALTVSLRVTGDDLELEALQVFANQIELQERQDAPGIYTGEVAFAAGVNTLDVALHYQDAVVEYGQFVYNTAEALDNAPAYSVWPVVGGLKVVGDHAYIVDRNKAKIAQVNVRTGQSKIIYQRPEIDGIFPLEIFVDDNEQSLYMLEGSFSLASQGEHPFNIQKIDLDTLAISTLVDAVDQLGFTSTSFFSRADEFTVYPELAEAYVLTQDGPYLTRLKYDLNAGQLLEVKSLEHNIIADFDVGAMGLAGAGYLVGMPQAADDQWTLERFNMTTETFTQLLSFGLDGDFVAPVFGVDYSPLDGNLYMTTPYQVWRVDGQMNRQLLTGMRLENGDNLGTVGHGLAPFDSVFGPVVADPEQQVAYALVGLVRADQTTKGALMAISLLSGDRVILPYIQ